LVLRQSVSGDLNLQSSRAPETRVRAVDLDVAVSQDPEEDALTEATSLDDPVADAFRKALNDSDHDVEEEDREDEIVWKPGYG
jgi:hypothetical protein